VNLRYSEPVFMHFSSSLCQDSTVYLIKTTKHKLKTFHPKFLESINDLKKQCSYFVRDDVFCASKALLHPLASRRKRSFRVHFLRYITGKVVYN
jgi:hypothetical protein